MNNDPETLSTLNTAPPAIEGAEKYFFRASAEDFKKIPGSPIAYWVSEKILGLFEKYPIIEKIALPKQGTTIGENDRFLRLWFEISSPFEDKWKKTVKGGPFRRWYGNSIFVINWADNGKEIRLTGRATIRNSNYLFREGIEWSRISSAIPAFRALGNGFFHESASGVSFPKKEHLNKVLSLFNTKLTRYFLGVLNPTLTFQSGDIARMPYVNSEENLTVDTLIAVAKKDWDSYETSWDFSLLPLLQADHLQPILKATYHKLRAHWLETTLEMQRLEKENNRIFIEAYGLQDELTPDVPLHEITLTCNSSYRYGKGKTEEEYKVLQRTDTIKELISYAIGCMMGRYSLDNPGLIYAHSGNIDFDPSKYKTFSADDDGIIPVMDMDWFEDDATPKFFEFIKTAWPPETLDENLKFIADSLNPKSGESPEVTIRRYLSAAFFKDHMQTYKKRPIYWLFSSGKQKAFECLVYLHRYNDATLSRMRSNYVTPLQGNISARIEFLEHEKDAATTASNQKKIQKEVDILKKKQAELKFFDDELRHYADMKISIDLDDGVKVNCGKFGGLVAFSF